MFYTNKQYSDLILAIEVYTEFYTDAWDHCGDKYTWEEYSSATEAFDEIVKANIDYNQFIENSGIAEFKQYLVM